jgi:hypothetical protein
MVDFLLNAMQSKSKFGRFGRFEHAVRYVTRKRQLNLIGDKIQKKSPIFLDMEKISYIEKIPVNDIIYQALELYIDKKKDVLAKYDEIKK